MKRLVLAIVLIALCASLAVPAVAQTAKPAQVKYASYWVIYAERGPTWVPQTSPEGMEARMEVIEGLRTAYAEGDIIIAGLINDGTEAEFVIIMQTEDEMGLRERLSKGKYVANGFFELEIHSFHAPAGLTLETIPR